MKARRAKWMTLLCLLLLGLFAVSSAADAASQTWEQLSDDIANAPAGAVVTISNDITRTAADRQIWIPKI